MPDERLLIIVPSKLKIKVKLKIMNRTLRIYSGTILNQKNIGYKIPDVNKMIVEYCVMKTKVV